MPPSSALTTSNAGNSSVCSALSLVGLFRALFFKGDVTCLNPQARKDFSDINCEFLLSGLKNITKFAAAAYEKNSMPKNALALSQALIEAEIYLRMQLISPGNNENEDIKALIREELNAIDCQLIELKEVMRKDSKVYAQFLLPSKFITEPKKIIADGLKIDIVPASDEQKEEVKKVILKLIEDEIFSVSYIFLALESPGFNIGFFDGKTIKTVNGESRGGFFHNLSNTLVLNSDEVSAIGFSHESLHAGTAACNPGYPNPRSILPMSRDTDLMDLHSALSEGQNRLEKFKKIALKKNQQQKLTVDEEKFFQLASKATKKCLTRPIFIGSPPEHMALIKQEFQKSGIMQFPLLDLGYMPARINSLVESPQSGVYVTPIDPINAFIFQYSHAVLSAELPVNKRTKELFVAEKEAHLTQSLSRAAMQFFFPELLALRETFHAECTAKELNHNSTCYRR